MTDRIGVASICLHLSSALYVIAGLVFLGYSRAPDQASKLPAGAGLAGFVLCLAFAAGIEMAAWGLRRRRYWGRIAGVCILTPLYPHAILTDRSCRTLGSTDASDRALFGVKPLECVSWRPGSSSMARVGSRLLLLNIALLAVAIAYVQVSGVGMPPYHPVPEPSELDTVQCLVGPWRRGQSAAAEQPSLHPWEPESAG